jgi:hypothetical protein
MRLPLLQSPAVSRPTSRGPAWIGIGLAVLVLNAWFPAVPVVTAMALVAAGATAVTVERFRATPGAYFVVVLNFLVYCSLYALFFGATLHQALARADHQLGTLATIDLAASAWPLAIAVATSWNALRSCEPVR